MASLSNIVINTREDLEAIKGTPEHEQFMRMLKESLWSFVKNDDLGKWQALESNALIEQFGFTRKDFEPIEPPDLPEYVPPPPPDPKMVGIEFAGVMCSATRDDQNGLVAVLQLFQMQGAAFQPTVFHFANGSRLTLTRENIPAFTATWTPFRQSFFQPETV